MQPAPDGCDLRGWLQVWAVHHHMVMVMSCFVVPVPELFGWAGSELNAAAAAEAAVIAECANPVWR